MKLDFYRKNLRLIVIETVLSSIGVGFAVSIINIFWKSVGMNQTDVGITQMVFTISIMIFDIPLGYVADRFNRKVLNIIGDLGSAFSFMLYAFSQNMVMVVTSECLLGFFSAMTNGVDQSFIKFNCEKIDPSGELFKKANIKVQIARYFALLITTALGGVIAKFSLRVAIGASFVPYFVSGIIAFFIVDENEKLAKKANNPIYDMIIAIKDILKSNKTKALLMASVTGNEVTHAQVWVLTPLLLMVGVPIEIVSLGWVMNFLMQTIGGRVSLKMIHLKPSKMYLIPMLIEFTWITILIIHVNIVTVWLFALNGFVHGLIRTNITTSLQESAKNEVQTSIMSISATFGRLLYIPCVYFVNYLGNIKLIYSLIGVLIIFVPLFLITMYFLKKQQL